MYRVTNKAQFDAKIAAWIAAVKAGAERAVTRMARDAQRFATLSSPTFSGDFASNWNVSYGTVDTTFHTSGGDYMPIGNNLRAQAINSALSVTQGRFNMQGFKLGQKVFIANSAAHDEPYAILIERNQINFRPVNMGKDRVAGKTYDHLRHTYATIKKGMMV